MCVNQGGLDASADAGLSENGAIFIAEDPCYYWRPTLQLSGGEAARLERIASGPLYGDRLSDDFAN